jgi:hypothetical protein
LLLQVLMVCTVETMIHIVNVLMTTAAPATASVGPHEAMMAPPPM